MARLGREKKWEKLDNTAKIFPVIADNELTNTYRLSFVLKEMIDPVLLQEALDIVLPKTPGFNQRLRTGIFWYYLEENGKKAPRVTEESEYPCRYIHPSKNNNYLFRVTYYKRRINVEAFHVLADGMGIIMFMRELVYQYLRLSHPKLKEKLGDGFSSETSLDREDSFKRHFKSSAKSTYKIKRAFLIKGERLPYKGFGVMHGYCSVSELKEVAKSYGVSINEYLVAAFIYGTYTAYRGRISKNRPIRVAVPVNLRAFFDSMTTKNFFVMVSAEFIPEKDDYSFGEIAEITRDSLRSQIYKENLEEIFSYNVSNEQTLIARAVPLPLKNIAMKFVYTKSALANTTTITNIGNVTVLKEYEPYIDHVHCFIAFSKGQKLKGTITSFGDKLCYSFVSAFADTSVQKGIFRQMAADGVRVEIETNGVFG
ncbi:MAG: hypothetical protein J6N76_04335 [Lachnospiraceae bacterium]|nr:hypothetical protein [Lachnospiraceae bacterium]